MRSTFLKSIFTKRIPALALTAIIIFVGVFSFSINVKNVDAASTSVRVNNQNAKVGDKILVQFFFDTSGVLVNTVEGSINIKTPASSVEVTELSVGGSQLQLWPEKPSLDNSGAIQTIKFTGGVPAGFNKAEGLLFTMAITPKKVGSIIIEPSNVTAYQADGTGTAIKSDSKSFTLNVTEASGPLTDEWANLISKDTTPPELFTVNVGQDFSMFDGKKFISFEAVDSESGIAYYEVKEGNAPAVRSGSPYVLQDQITENKITVIAYDKAGNSRIVTWSPSNGLQITWPIILVVIIFLVLFIGILAYILKKQYKNKERIV